MSPILKQTVRNKNISFWKILAMIVMAVIIMNIAIDFFSRYGASFGSIAAIVSLILCSIICGKIVYKNLAYYNYRIVEDELMVERVIGRANHIFFHIKPNDIQDLKPYNEVDQDNKDIKTFKFVVDNDKDKWYAIEFLKEDKVYRLIMEPNQAFLSALKSNFERVKEDRVISS